MKSKYILISLLLFVFLLSDLHASQVNRSRLLKVTSVIVDQEGSPIANARIYANEGSVIETSDIEGRFTITARSGSVLLIEADQYASKTLVVYSDEYSQIGLEKLPYQLAENDLVNIPFGQTKKRYLVGSVSTLNPEDLTAFDSRNGIMEALNGRVPGLFGNSNVYGLGSTIIVDGIARNPSFFNLQEVDQITVIRDAGTRMLYGAEAGKPLIMVTTKRGVPYKRQLNVFVESGIQNPVSFPEFLDAADYMTLFNEARMNDGLSPRFDSLTITNTRSGTNSILYPDEHYYTSRYLKEFLPFYKVHAESSGGNDQASYYAYLGWDGRQGLLAVGPEESVNQFNIRGNVDYTINEYMKMRFNGATVFNISNGSRFNFWSDAASFHPHNYPVLIPSSMVTDSVLLSGASMVNGDMLLGGTSEYQSNIYGNLSSSGYSKSFNRLLQFDTGIDYDLGFIADGLTAKTYLNFDLYNRYSIAMENQYAVYQPVTSIGYNDNNLLFQKIGQDVKAGAEAVRNPDFYRKIGFFGVLNYNKYIDNKQFIDITGLISLNHLQEKDVIYRSRNFHYGTRATYSLDNKYIAELSGTLAGSPHFSRKNRWAFSPGVGLGWIASEEDFLAGTDWLDFLKFKANWSIIHTDAGLQDYYLFRSKYNQGWWFDYNHGVVRNYVREVESIGNEDLTWIKRQQFFLGFEALMINQNIWLEGGYFYSRYYDQIVRRSGQYTRISGGIYPYENYGSDMDQGFEAGINVNRSIGQLKLNLGSNVAFSVPKVLEIDEPDYGFDYMQRLNQPSDAMFGWVALGFFDDQDDIDSHATQTFGSVRPGDIKYKDVNNDGVINQYDQVVIGNSRTRFQYSVNLHISYKYLELFMLGTGQQGQNSIFRDPYYWVYGENKYSKEVLGRWTPETAATATYPALSSDNNDNNFRNSTFWLEKNNWFTLHSAQLSYELPKSITGIAFMKQIKLFVRGQNLFTVSPIREKRELNIGGQPQYRIYSFGVKALF